MRGSPAWPAGTHIQRAPRRRHGQPRPRGPPARAFCDLTKRHFMIPISARTGGHIEPTRMPGPRIATPETHKGEIRHATRHTFHLDTADYTRGIRPGRLP